MRVRSFLLLLLISVIAAACGPADRVPVFNLKALPSATSIPMPAEVPRVVATFSHRIVSFDVSPDGSAIALATSDGVVLYDLKTARRLRAVGRPEIATRVAWSPDGRKLAVASIRDYGVPFYVGGDSSNSAKAHLTVWDASTWKSVFEPDFGLEMVNQMFRAMAWSPDGRLLASTLDTGGVLVFDTQTENVVSHQGDFSATVLGIAWSPDSSRLVATNDMAYGIRRWRISDDQSVRLFDRRVSSSMAIAWSPDGTRIASGHYPGGVCFWTVATNKCDGFIQAHRTATFGLTWSPDGGRLATAGGVIRIWDTQTGKLLTAFGEDGKYIYNQIEWPITDGPIVSLQTGMENLGDTVVRLWDVANGSIVKEFQGRQWGE